jgi:hypothetical protein
VFKLEHQDQLVCFEENQSILYPLANNLLLHENLGAKPTNQDLLCLDVILDEQENRLRAPTCFPFVHHDLEILPNLFHLSDLITEYKVGSGVGFLEESILF